jgi:hypothetical protein
MIRIHFTEFDFEWHGLEAPLSCQLCAPSYYSYCNYPWWGKLECKGEVPWLLVKRQRKMLANFVVVIKIAPIPGT